MQSLLTFHITIRRSADQRKMRQNTSRSAAKTLTFRQLVCPTCAILPEALSICHGRATSAVKRRSFASLVTPLLSLSLSTLALQKLSGGSTHQSLPPSLTPLPFLLQPLMSFIAQSRTAQAIAPTIGDIWSFFLLSSPCAQVLLPCVSLPF